MSTYKNFAKCPVKLVSKINKYEVRTGISLGQYLRPLLEIRPVFKPPEFSMRKADYTNALL